MEELYAQANKLADREIEVQKIGEEKFIVEWMSFQHKPPPVGATEKEALEKFIEYLTRLQEGNHVTADDRA